MAYLSTLTERNSFNTQPPEGGWVELSESEIAILFQHTAARRRLACIRYQDDKTVDCFNTQPPEGGWGKRQKGRLSR